MTTLQILTTVATAIVAPNVVFAAWVGRNEWRRGRARRTAVAFDVAWEQNARMLGARGGSR